MTTTPVPSQAGEAPVRRGNVLAALEVPGYSRIWASGFLWSMARWQCVFLGAYVVNQLTHSPFLVQVVGASFYAPMFFGGVLGGVVSDRFDRRRTILVNIAVLAPFAFLIGALALAGVLRAWMVFPFMLAIGIGGVVDMTSRRALVFDYVGADRATNAIALEVLSGMGGSMAGSFVAGAVLNVAGPGEAFVLLGITYAFAFLLMLSTRTQPRAGGGASASVWTELRAGLGYVRAQPPLVSILGITVIQNIFWWSYITLVPVFAENLGANALFTGILASGTAMGSMLGTVLIARGLGMKRGTVYLGGSMAALAFLFLFAASPWYWLALVAHVGAGVGMAGYSTMQSLLMMTYADPSMRGRAVGLLSMAIGSVPFSLLALGAVAEVTGPSAAVMGSAALGLLAMSLWNLRYPQARRLA